PRTPPRKGEGTDHAVMEAVDLKLHEAWVSAENAPNGLKGRRVVFLFWLHKLSRNLLTPGSPGGGVKR
ncbi:hypothetical protein, partial [Methylorubrum podarium]|uniref:hypothetical protein n=1 Tax=Methylorubrum podarium TaxID=200476 RepID=UPI001EE2DF17